MEQRAAPSTVILDYGGVLADHYVDPWWSDLLERLDAPSEVVDQLLHETSAHGAAYRRGDCTAREFWDEVTRGRGVVASHEELALLWAASYIPNPEALAVVDGLRAAGVRVGVFMNSDEYRHRYIEDTYHLSDRMDFVGSSNMFGATKPDRVAFERLATHFGFDPTRALYVDDKTSNAEASEAAGMRGLHCPTPPDLGPLLAERYGL